MTRRNALQGAGALLGAGLLPARAEDAEVHGLSSFGDLALPPDFKSFSYVNPKAPKAGLLSLQITSTTGNQNFETFDTLNIFSRKGDGAAGMGATFDSLMTSNGDEPDSVYGLIAKSVRVSADKLQYRFRLRPQAHFS
ncbi:MAG TPA: ABC transporter substrate-binding protein, partial [Roseiarcus sp.]|nr:ABC transporter substrate-binding protein [Roseiarcus sp.]